MQDDLSSFSQLEEDFLNYFTEWKAMCVCVHMYSFGSKYIFVSKSMKTIQLSSGLIFSSFWLSWIERNPWSTFFQNVLTIMINVMGTMQKNPDTEKVNVLELFCCCLFNNAGANVCTGVHAYVGLNVVTRVQHQVSLLTSYPHVFKRSHSLQCRNHQLG